MQKSKIFLWVLLAFVSGIWLGSFTANPRIVWILVLSGAVSCAAGARKRKLSIAGIMLLCAAFGVFRYGQYDGRQNLDPLYGRLLRAEGYISEDPEIKGNMQYIVAALEKIGGDKVQPFSVRIIVRAYPERFMGEKISFEGVLREPENTGEFDYVSYLAKDGIFAQSHFPKIENKGSVETGIKVWLSRLKHSFEGKINAALPEPHAAFLRGILLGERAAIPPDLKESLSRTGTTHLVALSGYNITIVARFFIALLLFLTVPFRFSFWIAMLGIIGFVALTGAAPSVVRAGIMGVLVLIAEREGRIYRVTNALVFAGAVMIFHNPKILRFDAAFQLSFLATLGLIYIAPAIHEKLDRFCARRLNISENKYTNVKKTFAETLGAQLAVLPLLVALFGTVSIVSPLANVLILLAVPYAMGSGFVAGAAGFLWEPLGRIVGIASWVLLEYILRVIDLLARVPFASVALGGTGGTAIAVLLLLLLWYKLKIKKATVSPGVTDA